MRKPAVAPLRRLGLGLGLGFLFGCSAIVDTRLTGGIGAQCASDADCHAASCSINEGNTTGICVKECASDIDCPRPAHCVTAPASAGAGLCQLQLPVQAFFIGDGTSDEGFSQTHQQGLTYAQAQLGYLSGADMPTAGVTWAFSNFVF